VFYKISNEHYSRFGKRDPLEEDMWVRRGKEGGRGIGGFGFHCIITKK